MSMPTLALSIAKVPMPEPLIGAVQEVVVETALDLGVHFIACTTTMGLMGITKDTLIDGIDQFAGVTTYLAEAKQGSVNLFI